MEKTGYSIIHSYIIVKMPRLQLNGECIFLFWFCFFVDACLDNRVLCLCFQNQILESLSYCRILHHPDQTKGSRSQKSVGEDGLPGLQNLQTCRARGTTQSELVNSTIWTSFPPLLQLAVGRPARRFQAQHHCYLHLFAS